jgi:hypothetical protein
LATFFLIVLDGGAAATPAASCGHSWVRAGSGRQRTGHGLFIPFHTPPLWALGLQRVPTGRAGAIELPPGSSPLHRSAALNHEPGKLLHLPGKPQGSDALPKIRDGQLLFCAAAEATPPWCRWAPTPPLLFSLDGRRFCRFFLLTSQRLGLIITIMTNEVIIQPVGRCAVAL